MKKIAATLAIVALMASLAMAQETPPAPTTPLPSVTQQKAPTLADYQSALQELRGKQNALEEVKKAVEQQIGSTWIQMDRVNQKIQELSPKK